jgi:hypothetical protein
MGNQLISFRLRDEEVALLMQQACPTENANSTAQRLIRQWLGTASPPPDRLTSLITQVDEFQEQVKSIKGFVDEAIDQRLDAVNQLVNQRINQQMQTERLQMRSRFDQMDRRLEQYVQTQRASVLKIDHKHQATDHRTENLFSSFY